MTTSLQKSLTVFAAASLTDAFRELGAVYEVSSGVSVSFNFGASTQLRTQLEQGAAADVFASADQIQMDTARGAGVVRGADIPFARNRLVIITPRNNPAGILRPLDLANPGIKVVTASSEVPIGVYTQNMLDAMSQTEGIGPRFKDAVNANIVSREPNVRQVVAKVQLGEADAAVVYLTDVTPSSAADLMTVTIPDELNTIATYPIALVSTSPQPELGNAFIDLVLSAAGQAILQRWSFTPVGPTALNQQPRPSAPEQAAS
ncbi:MAG: molybdate ABC transporter substrate-binding protein [Chloroflexota bacterium]